MTVWELAASIEGYNDVHGNGDPVPPTDEEFKALIENAAKLEATRPVKPQREMKPTK